MLALLQELAAYHRKQAAPQVLAITGSNGKTTTKELIAAIIFQAVFRAGHKGEPEQPHRCSLTLLSLRGEEVAVIEMGANHPGEIETLSRIASPDLGLITNVGKAHLEGFGSLKGVLMPRVSCMSFWPHPVVRPLSMAAMKCYWRKLWQPG